MFVQPRVGRAAVSIALTVAPVLVAAGVVLGGPAAQASDTVQVPLVNDSFDAAWTASGPSCWATRRVGTGASTLTASSPGTSGAHSARLRVTRLAASGSRTLVTSRESRCAPPAEAGERMSVTAAYVGTRASRWVLHYRTSSGWHYLARSPRFAARGTWGRASWTAPALPTGTTSVSVGVMLRGTGTLRVDDVRLAAKKQAPSSPTATPIPTSGAVVSVSTAPELSTALGAARPGETIVLRDGTYQGNFTLRSSGTATAPIRVTGGRGAILDGGMVSSGYVLHLDNANYVQIDGITVMNGQKAVVLDQSSHVTLQNLDLHRTGEELVLLRNYSRDNLVAHNDIHDSGRVSPGYGEGVYIGLSRSNWSTTQSRTSGQPDTSDRNSVVDNHIYDTSAENVDVKEGTTGGLISGNLMDSSALSGANYADSWVDVAGNGYTVANNSGVNNGRVLVDGYQTHIQATGWATGNVFKGNSSAVNGSGYAVNVQTPSSGNVVYLSNTYSAAQRGLTNIAVTP